MKTSNTSSPQKARLYTANILHHFPLHFFFAGAFAWLLWSGAAPGSSAETMLAITVQPTDQYDCTSNMASFSITATGAGSYQWFRSSDEGANWIPLGNGDYGLLAGVNTPTLTASGGSLVLINGLLFRCQVSDGSTTLNSAAARFQIGLPATSIQYGHTGYCTGAGPVAVVLTGAQGGTFTASPAGLSIHAANGQITPGTSTPNTYTVTYHIPAQHGCAAINATTLVSISTNVQPVISYGAVPLCHHETSVPVSLSGAGSGTFSSSAGLSVNSATGAINPSASTPGTYTVTYTTSGAAATGCTAYMATATVTINDQLNATITGGGNHNCAGGSYNLTVTGTPNSIVTYKINGGDDLTLTIGGSGTTVLNTGSLRENTSYQLVSVRFADTEFCARPLSSTANLTFNRPYLTYAVSAPATANEGEVVNIDITNRPFTIILYQINGGLVQSALINNSTGLISIPVTVNGTTTFTRFSSSYQSSPTCSTTYPDSVAVVISVAACPPVGTIWYVDASAAPGGTGSSWTCAFQNLQDAIDAASSGHEIWVKAGTYLPTKDPFGNASPADPRDRTFYLKNGVGVYGGFAGTETMRSQRNWTTNVTTLSGDIGTSGDNTDNCYHVVLSVNDGNTTVLDGFTVNSGNANGSETIIVETKAVSRDYGGGMYNFSSSPTLANCTFSGNSAGSRGGGLNIQSSSSPSLTDCTFSSNSAGDGGGLSSAPGTSPSLTNCTFTGNSASSGGAMLIVFCTTILTGCTFTGNSGPNGAGIYMSTGSATVSKCVFSGHSGIAVFISQASPVFTDCLFTGNSSLARGSGIYAVNNAAPTLTNCTFSGNNTADSSGGGIYSTGGALTLTNCLIWNNRANGVTGSASANLFKTGSAPVITYSLIQNQNPAGTGNLNGITNAADANYPNFLTPLDPATAPSTSGNFRLSDCSPAANVGDNTDVSATDLDGNPRIFNTTVDLGAYERQTNGTAPAIWYADADGDTFGNPAVSQSTCDGAPTGYVSNNLDCDDTNNALNPNTVWYLDADGDGYYTGAGITQCASPGAGYRYTGILGGGDCDDSNAAIRPGATESCNGIDDNCNGMTDEGISFVTYYQDSDGDTFGNPAVSQSTCDGPPTGYVSNSLDCNDSNNALNPNTVWYLDADGDNYYTGAGMTQCASPGAGYRYTGILGGGDCDDSNAAIRPGATESCNGIDDNCNGMTDEGITFVTYYQDSDGDTFGNPAVSQSTCDGPPTGYVSNSLDCNDTNNALNPNTVWYLDADGDNYYTGAGITQCASPGAGYRYTGILGGGDCDDSNAAIRPGATESCNGIDDNCNGMTDEGITFVTYYQDSDGDTFGNPAVSQSTCDGPPTGYVSNNLDCNDTNNALNPNTVWYLDADGDGYYTGAGITQCASPGAGYRYTGILGGGDCDDSNAAIHPGATESCNGIDDNCNGMTDEGITFVTYYQDSDGDTFGNPAVSQSTCDGPPTGYVSNNLDCNDSNNALNPNTVWYLDADGDGYYTGTGVTQCASPGAGYRYTGILGGGDCDDSNSAIRPGATESCNGIDDNCNGMTDEGITFVTYYQDSDGDTFGNPAVSQSTCDGPPTGYVSNSLDCNDTNNTLNPNTLWYLDADGDGYYTGTGVTQCASPGAGYRYTGILSGGDCNDGSAAVNPGGSESCNGIDDNCNGMVDENNVCCPAPGMTWYVDASAAPGGTGSSWACAFQNLQDAINAASSGHEIWVKAGTYKPTAYPSGCSGCGTQRDYTFHLKDGVAIYGGFAGVETMRSQRNWTTNVTTLSGDIGAVGDNSDNAHHVVLAVNCTNTTVLDGFTISNGKADGAGFINVGMRVVSRRSGSGMYNHNAAPSVTNCTFSDNSADSGAGMANDNAAPTLTNCTFSANSATFSGGGIYSSTSSNPTLVNCIFSNNNAANGGGMFSTSTRLTATGCTFLNNTASSTGGGVDNSSTITPLVFTNCIFSGNSANSGGGMYNTNAAPALSNCLFSGNLANNGGGMYNATSGPAFTNCTITGNTSTGTEGGGLANLFGSIVTLNNCVVWNNRSNGVTGSALASMSTNTGSAVNINYSLIQNHNPAGTGNLNGIPNAADANYPGFVTPLDPATAPSTAGDFQITNCSPVLNLGTNTNAPGTDLYGNTRPFGSAVDMGVHELQNTSNIPTTANAGPDQAGATTCGLTEVTLAANNPTVGAGAWSIVSGTGGTITTPSSPTSTFSGTAGSTYTLRWTISNSPCTASTDDVMVTFNPLPTIGLGASPSVFPGTTSAGLPYSSVTNSPNQYSIDYDMAANTAGFTDVTNAALPGSPIGLVVPGAAAPGVYNATLTVRNNTTGCIGAATPFTVTISSCPSQFTVNDLGDGADATPGDGVCATNGGACTLRAAIEEANALTACSPLTIHFSVTGTITLGSALPAIAHPNLSITGPGASGLTISGNNSVRVMSIANGNYNVNISGLTLANGYIKGADVTAMSGANTAFTESGAGLYSLSSGMVNVTDCVITNNTAQGGNATGGTNVVGGIGQGAGIYLQGGAAKLTRCTISNNSALGGLGMGGTTLTLDGTGRGAGVYKESGSLAVEDCTIADNIVDRIPGSILSNFSQAQGGGIYNASGALSISGSTFNGNRRPNTRTLAGAAIANQANNISWTLTNCTFSGNTGSNTIAHIQTNGTLTMVNCTVANNTLSTTNVAAGAIFVAGGSTLNLKNTVLGNNADGPNVRKNGTVISQGNNFDSDGTTGFTDGVNGDIVGTNLNKKNPLLSALGNYGGLTETMALLPGSPAIDAGTSSDAPATDQRGIARVGNVDIGAFESQGFTLAVNSGNNQTTNVNTAFANPLSVTVGSAFGEPVNGGQVIFTPPGSGASATIAGNPVTIAGGTATSGIVTANATAGGPYNVAAGAMGAAATQFSLSNSPVATVDIALASANPACASSSVTWTVTFDMAVTGLTAGNFNLVGGTGAMITNVSGSGTTWTVTAGTGNAATTLGLNMVNSTGVIPTVIGLPGVGQTYTVNDLPSTANAGPDQTNSATCGLTQVTLAGNTPTVGTGAWSVVSGTGGTITTPSNPTSTFSGTAGSTYTLRWTISNSPCTASTDDVVITFNSNPGSPTFNIANNSCPATTGTIVATGCGIGTVVEYATNATGPWSTTAPAYTTSAFTVYARCRNTTTGCVSQVVSETTAPVVCCPNLSAAPGNVIINNGICGPACEPFGASLSAPTLGCPTGSTIQYSVNNGAWTTTLPTYSAGLSIQTRCLCDADNTVFSPASSGATTNPANCADNTPPTAICSDATVIFNGQENISLDVNDLATASDNCGIQSVTLNTPAVTCQQVGQTVPVIVTVRDLSNNLATCIANVTIGGLPCGWSQTPNGVGCAGGNSNSYNPATGVWTATSTNCFYGPPFTQDASSFAQRRLCGDGSITVQVTSIVGGGWAGVVMRESNAPGAKKAQLLTNLSQYHRREFRTATNGQAAPQQISSNGRHWLRIVRAGNQFTLYASGNGTSWFVVGAQNIVMGNCIEMGLVATNQTANSSVTAAFAGVSFTGSNGILGSPLTPHLSPLTPLDSPLTPLDSPLTSEFDVFPNPTGGELNVDLTQYVGRDVRIEVYSIEGKLLQFREIEEVQTTVENLNLSQYAGGMYFVKVQSRDLPAATKRVVLNR